MICVERRNRQLMTGIQTLLGRQTMFDELPVLLFLARRFGKHGRTRASSFQKQEAFYLRYEGIIKLPSDFLRLGQAEIAAYWFFGFPAISGGCVNYFEACSSNIAS